MTEEATDGESWGPNTQTLGSISKAAFEFEDYLRIVDVLHKRFHFFYISQDLEKGSNKSKMLYMPYILLLSYGALLLLLFWCKLDWQDLIKETGEWLITHLLLLSICSLTDQRVSLMSFKAI